MNRVWVWLDPRIRLAVHEEQFAEHRGAAGMRELGLFESTLAKPKNPAVNGDPDAAALAASYGCDIARNHPFVDGNERAAFVVTALFLWLNDVELTADDQDCVMTKTA